MPRRRDEIPPHAILAEKPTPMHFHDKDLVVVTDGGEIETTTPDGASRVLRVARGEASFNPKIGRTARSSRPARPDDTLVELK